jgi:CheY-like chemotaxis protein
MVSKSPGRNFGPFRSFLLFKPISPLSAGRRGPAQKSQTRSLIRADTLAVALACRWPLKSLFVSRRYGCGTRQQGADLSTTSEAFDGELGTLARLCVLAVDDNRMNRALLAANLQPLAVDLTLASNGDEAIRLSRMQRFDVILMDVHMPGLNGFEASKMIRQEDGSCNRRTPIIAFTAERGTDGDPDLYSACFDGIIEKPVLAATLFRTLLAVASRRGS